MLPGFLRLKEWAYAGIVFELSGAAASLAASGRNADLIAPLFLLGLALASWIFGRPTGRWESPSSHDRSFRLAHSCFEESDFEDPEQMIVRVLRTD